MLDATHDAPSTTAATWTRPRRFAFRAWFVLVLIRCAPFPLDVFPFGEPVSTVIETGWTQVGAWVGHHVLRFPAETNLEAMDVGDRKVDYILVGVHAALALLAAGAWTLLDRRGRDHPWLAQALRVYVRYVLILVMLGYGISKLLKVQFLDPPPDLLFQTLGGLAPMRLLWLFMGASLPYTVFGGALETLAALLLCFRRTTLLGALTLATVMVNVVMLNLSYDVSVKLFSTQWLVFCLYLIAPDARRLTAVLFGHAAPARPPEPELPDRRLRWAMRGAKVALLGVGIWTVSTLRWDRYVNHGNGAPVPALYGVWEVESFRRDGVELPPLLGDAARWRRYAFLRSRSSAVQGMDDRWERFTTKDDAAGHTLTLTPSAPPGSAPLVLQYVRVDPEHLELSGPWKGAPISLRLKRVDLGQLPLLKQGFRWTQD